MSQRPRHALLRLSSKVQHAILENSLFTILNGKPSGFPAVVPSRSEPPSPSPRDLTISKLKHPSWFTESMPYLCFVPAHNPFETEWLSPLNYTEEAIPVVRDYTQTGRGARFILQGDVIVLWTLLERDLRKLLRAAMRLANVGIAKSFHFCPYPKQYGYCELHPTEAMARRQVAAARDAFLPLSAAVSYFILRFKSRLELRDLQLGVHFPDPRDLEEAQWREVLESLQKATGLSSIWLTYWRNFLQQAPVVGVYFEVKNATPECLHHVPILAKVGVPLGLYWGDATETWHIPKALRAWGPPLEVFDCLAQIRYGNGRLEACVIAGLETQVAVAQAGRYATARIKGDIYELSIFEYRTSGTSQNPFTSSPSLAQALPRTSSCSSKDMQSFFRRRQQEREVYLARESLVDRQRRLQRESVAARDLPPGRKGATVFYWELVDGVRHRKAAGRQNYEIYWEQYGSNQRRYDSVRNEWDVCTDFDPEDTPSWSDDESDTYEPDCTYDIQILSDEDVEEVFDIQEGSTYLQHLHGEQRSTFAYPPIEFSDPLEELSYYRFGLVDHSEGSEVIVSNGSIVDWERVPNLLGNARSQQAPQLRKSTREVLRVFFTGVLHAHNLSEAPKNLDLNIEDADIQRSWSFSVFYEDVMDGYYFIKPWSQHPLPFQLALKSASAVLEIARHGWGPNPKDIMQNLVREGIPFNTFIRDTPRSQELQFPHSRPLLGYRDKDFLTKGSVQAVPEKVREEYRAYEFQRDRFLRTKRGRAAILAGGVIARIAKHIVKEEAVLHGPSSDVWSFGQCIWDGYEDSLGCWDDQLTESEIDLICGVYDVGTGERDRWGYMQVGQKSWWPKPTAWKVSGLCCGYWSRDAEAWFQRRLDHLSKGSAIVLSNKEWKASIKFTKDAFRLSQKNDELAGLYLKRRFGSS